MTVQRDVEQRISEYSLGTRPGLASMPHVPHSHAPACRHRAGDLHVYHALQNEPVREQPDTGHGAPMRRLGKLHEQGPNKDRPCESQR